MISIRLYKRFKKGRFLSYYIRYGSGKRVSLRTKDKKIANEIYDNVSNSLKYSHNQIVIDQKNEACRYEKFFDPRLHSNGYIQLYRPAYNRASNGVYVFEHIIIAEKVLGKPLPDGAVVHHVDGDRKNNSPNNLVICQDQGYHLLLHQRQRAYDAFGHADWPRCKYCHEHDSPTNLTISTSYAYHKTCHRDYRRKQRAR
ncbi:uncharacterized protein Dvar_36510 [Desulfosarcina variabilis str. Montpellier]|uniref:HNH endonuclease signature motif containing protein n=1 Tax=Desulfosarcina variabilis TaxID=2300 RepID=UPI003AFA2A58